MKTNLLKSKLFTLLALLTTLLVSAQDHISDFTSLGGDGQGQTLVLPESHTFQLIFQQGETYTVQNDIINNNTVPGNHDFTGYVPIADSSTNGYVSVNHENSPGGVSILDVSFDNGTNLWEVTATEAVDFYDENLVTTIRNCSGGVTPMGTIITAEESSSDDSNGDGYEDVGWLVEIDPVTKQVMDYDNDGKKDKLWAMGKMAHENVVISQDGTVAYYGEDGGSDGIYKFVPTTPFDFSEGALFALSANISTLDGAELSGNATWISVPNDTQEERNNVSDFVGGLTGTNFDGVEDCEISEVDGHVYVASKGYSRVYRFTDDGDGTSDFETFVGGVTTTYTLQTENGPTAVPWLNGNDNLTIDNEGNVWVLQDGGQNYVWVVGVNHTQILPDVRIFSQTPVGAEPTGLTFTPDNKFGFYSIQHPSATGTQTDASGNEVSFPAGGSATVVFALAEDLGGTTLSASDFDTETIKVFPNPTQDMLNIQFPTDVSKASVRVYDIVGREVVAIENAQNHLNNNSLSINLNDYSLGKQIYLVEVMADGIAQDFKIVKSN